MVLGFLISLTILLICLIVFGIGFCFGHIKSEKRMIITLNLFDTEVEITEDGDGERLPENVTPIRTITNDGK